jgi:hypothetical protein
VSFPDISSLKEFALYYSSDLCPSITDHSTRFCSMTLT